LHVVRGRILACCNASANSNSSSLVDYVWNALGKDRERVRGQDRESLVKEVIMVVKEDERWGRLTRLIIKSKFIDNERFDIL
jgi:hypothetical protein